MALAHTAEFILVIVARPIAGGNMFQNCQPSRLVGLLLVTEPSKSDSDLPKIRLVTYLQNTIFPNGFRIVVKH